MYEIVFVNDCTSKGASRTHTERNVSNYCSLSYCCCYFVLRNGKSILHCRAVALKYSQHTERIYVLRSRYNTACTVHSIYFLSPSFSQSLALFTFLSHSHSPFVLFSLTLPIFIFLIFVEFFPALDVF